MTDLNFKQNKARFAAGIFALVLLFVLIFFTENNFLKDDPRMAQILAIETGLLKKWQEIGSLKKNLTYAKNGDEVRLLQRMLSQDTTAYPEKKITGYYGDATKQAVQNFQKEYGLRGTGEVDEITRGKLNEIFHLALCPSAASAYPDLSLRKIDKDNALPLDYAPERLLDVSGGVKTVGIICIKDEAATGLKKMFQDAEKDGVKFMVTSGYRRPEIQQYLYDLWLKLEGEKASDYIAKPGFSEHQLGTAVDLTDASIGYAGVSNKFAISKGGLWLWRNAQKYGFIMSFPKNKKKETGFGWEPWHWRFVGVETALRLKNEGKVFNELNLNEEPLVYKGDDKVTLSADAFVSIWVDSGGKEKILIEKNKNKQLPIASITKLMTAMIGRERLDDGDKIVFSDESLKTKGASGFYQSGESLFFKDAIVAMLIGSQNETASAIAEKIGTDEFVRNMNEKAAKLGLERTRFVNPSGVDPEIGDEEMNISTVYNIYQLVRFINEQYPDILEVTKRETFQIKNTGDVLIGEAINTNKLLSGSGLPFNVLGGKTGETARAKKNLVLMTDAPCGGKIISVVLDSGDNFTDMKKLLEYIDGSYSFACL